MAEMTDKERDEFLLEARLGNLAIARRGKGPLLAPIWYQYTPGGTIDVCCGANSAKAHRMRAEGRATISVVDPDPRRYRYVAAEGPVELVPLGAATRTAILAMSSRYLGKRGGEAYTEEFMRRLDQDDFPGGGHGSDEVMARIKPIHWRTEVLE